MEVKFRPFNTIETNGVIVVQFPGKEDQTYDWFWANTYCNIDGLGPCSCDISSTDKQIIIKDFL
jgi:hypothetical protein